MDPNAPVRIRFGTGSLPLSRPDHAATFDLLSGPEIPPLDRPEPAVRAALREPIGCAPLADLLRSKQQQLGRPLERVVITLSDITRPVPNTLLITALLEVLAAQGVRDDQVTLVIATGMHRESTPQEIRVMLGDDLPRRCRVVDHTAHRPETVQRVTDDPPVSVNRLYLEADFRIVTGLIEPHFMAGFSGGRKGVCPGLVDLETVQRFHGYATMADPNSVEGRLEGNPCHEISHQVAHAVGVDFLLNVAITHDRRPAGIYAGDLDAAFMAGCQDVARWTSADVQAPYDLVVTSAGGRPLDKNFYQTVKGMCTAMPALHDRSTLVICSDCDVVGEPAFEALYAQFGSDWRAFRDHIQATDGHTAKDQWQYQLQTRVLERVGLERLILCNDGLDTQTQRDVAVTPLPGDRSEKLADRLQAFVEDYAAEHPGCRIAVIPEGPYTMLNASRPAAVPA